MARHPIVRRPVVLVAAVTVGIVGIVLAAAQLPGARAASSAPGHAKKGGKGKGSCPSSSCGLVSEAEVEQAFDDLFTFLQLKPGVVLTTLSLDGTTCTATPIPSEDGFTGGCDVFAADLLPTVGSRAYCPPGYYSVAEFTCFGYILDVNALEILSFLPLAGTGTAYRDGLASAFCVVPSNSVQIPEGAQLVIEQYITCSYNSNIFDSGAKTAATTTSAAAAAAAAAPGAAAPAAVLASKALGRLG